MMRNDTLKGRCVEKKKKKEEEKKKRKEEKKKNENEKQRKRKRKIRPYYIDHEKAIANITETYRLV